MEIILRSIEIEDSEGIPRAREYVHEETETLRKQPRKNCSGNNYMLLLLRDIELREGSEESLRQRIRDHLRTEIERFQSRGAVIF